MKITVFSMPGCIPCKNVKDFLTQKTIEYTSIDLSEVDNLELGSQYNIRKVPVTILFNKEGDPLQKVLGFDTQDLKTLIDNYNGNI